METTSNKIKTTIKNIILFLCALSSTSCEKDTVSISDPSNPAQALNTISTAWGSTPSEIRKHMEGYEAIKDNDKTLIYESGTGETRIAYRFINDKLSASLLLVNNENGETSFENYLNAYQYIGNINNDRIYKSKEKNTIATIEEIADGKVYSSIGFAPLISDEYEKAEPLGVLTDSEINLSPTQVTLYGTVTGVEKEVEVGFLLSLSQDIDESNSRISSMKSNAGRFETTLLGILDQETYYYRAYAVIDGKTYYGEINSFETEPFTYTLNGKEFKVIKVDGGPYGTISVLQTEVSAKDEIVFAGKAIGLNLDNDVIDGNISLYESKKFFGTLLKITGLAWRYPTVEEWKFLASGGLESKQYEYAGSNDINEVAWYNGNCSSHQAPGLKNANELQLYDMSGNYSELSNDNQIENLKANKYLLASDYALENSQACGGDWSSNASQCEVNSHEATKFIKANVLFDGEKYALRLIYSHHINAYLEP